MIFYRGYQVLVFRDIAEPEWWVWEIWNIMNGQLVEDGSARNKNAAKENAKEVINEYLEEGRKGTYN